MIKIKYEKEDARMYDIGCSNVIWKRIKVAIVVLVMILSLCGIDTRNTYAALPELLEVPEDNYYGKNALAKMPNGESYVYVYEQIAAGIADCAANISVSNNQYSVSPSDIMMIFEIYCDDYPQHFWRNTGISYSYNGNRVISVRPYYNMSESEVISAKSEFDSGVAEVLSGIDASMSEFERELLIHDRLANRITYVLNASHEHDAYGAFVSGQAVCEGYARAFQYALYKVGIESMTVTGDAGGSHAWNLVKIDGKYYYTDVTWDDPSDKLYHAYFNLPLSEISKDHVLDMNIEMPACTSLDANYFTVMGGWLDSYTVDNIAQALKRNLKADLYFTCDTSNLWNWYKSNASTIAEKLGISGGYSYGYSNAGNEWILTLSGSRTVVSVTGVSMAQSTYTFSSIGEQQQVKASVLPSNATNTMITYSSTNTDVAVVNKYTGVVTTVGEGTAYIVAASDDGAKKAKTTVKVETPHVCSKSTVTHIAAASSTCMQTGNVEYYVCECGKYYSDENCDTKAEITDQSSVILEKTEHQFSGKWQHDDNGHWQLCEYGCGTKSDIEEHTGGNATADEKAKCAVCGSEYGDYAQKEEEALIANATVDKQKIFVGDSVTFTAAAAGGSGVYTYSYIVYNKTTGLWFRLADNISADTYTWTSGSVGDRMFYVDVKDENGTIVRSNAINVITQKNSENEILSVKGTTDGVSMKQGDKITLKASAAGGTGTYTYSYIVYNKNTGEWYRLADNISADEFIWMAVSNADRIFYIDVKDSKGTIVRSNPIEVTVSDDNKLAIYSYTDTLTVEKGKVIDITAQAGGGDGKYTYSFVVYNATTKSWYRFGDFSDSNGLTWTAASPGNRYFYAEVKDGSGKVVRSQALNIITK